MAYRRSLLVLSSLLAFTASAPAWADTDTGGAAVPEPTEISQAGCARDWQCGRGETLTIRGQGLDGVDSVEFLGAAGRADDRTARPRTAGPQRLTLIVPSGASTGSLRVRTFDDEVITAPRRLTIVSSTGAGQSRSSTAASDGVFPIRGHHDMGQTPTNGFGGGRGHQGQDMFADCGTPLVAVLDTTVQFEAFQDRAGNYVVLQDAAGRSYAYMHMRDRALVRKGDIVSAGERIGYVGQTGRATGCHLHFELWTAPGWYSGGHAIDPLPQLKAWEARDKSHH